MQKCTENNANKYVKSANLKKMTVTRVIQNGERGNEALIER